MVYETMTLMQTANGNIAGHGSVAEADGAVWREAFDRYGFFEGLIPVNGSLKMWWVLTIMTVI
jgi:hypothetical protein